MRWRTRQLVAVSVLCVHVCALLSVAEAHSAALHSRLHSRRAAANAAADPAAATTATPADTATKEAVKAQVKEENQAKKLDDPRASKLEEQTAAKRLDDPLIGPGALAAEMPSTAADTTAAAAGAVRKPKITIVSNVNVLNTQRRVPRVSQDYAKDLNAIEKTSEDAQNDWEKSHADQIQAVKDAQQKQNEEVSRMEEREQSAEKKEMEQALQQAAQDDKKKKQDEQNEQDRKNDMHVRQTEALKLVDTLKPWTADMGGDYDAPRVDRWSELCFVSGLAKGTNNGVVAYLPEWCRPASRIIFTLFTSNPATGGAAQLSRVDVLPDGRVYHVCCGTREGWMSFSGIWFDVADRESKPTLTEGWTVYGGGWRAPQINKVNGVCTLSGLARGSWAQNLGQLGLADCNPDGGALIFSGNNHEGIARLDVTNDGRIAYLGGGRRFDWVSLDGLLWTPGGGDNLNLLNGWTNFEQGWRSAKAQKLGRLCVVSGLIKSDAWNQHIATLPENCRPQKRLVFGVNVHDNNARVDVTPEGHVLFVYGKGQYNWLALDGIKLITFDQ